MPASTFIFFLVNNSITHASTVNSVMNIETFLSLCIFRFDSDCKDACFYVLACFMMIQAEGFLLKWHCAAHFLAFLLVSWRCLGFFFSPWLLDTLQFIFSNFFGIQQLILEDFCIIISYWTLTAPHIEDLVMLPTPVLRLLNVLDDDYLENEEEYEGQYFLNYILDSPIFVNW